MVTAVVAGANNTQIGAYTLSGNSASDISASITPAADFRYFRSGSEYQILLLANGAASPSTDDKVATLTFSDANGLQQTTMVFFTVRVNPQPLAVSYVNSGTPNTAPLTTTGDISVATIQINNGGYDSRRIAIVGNGGNFRLTEGTLILGGNNGVARMTAVTIHGTDAHNTESNTLSITVDVAATPLPAVGFVGEPNLFPKTVAAGSNIVIGTITVANGNLNSITLHQNGSDFSMMNMSVLVLGGDNASKRTASVTVQGDDNNAVTPPGSLEVIVTLDNTPPPITAVCSAGNTCRTLTVTAHNISDSAVAAGITTGSVNWRFPFKGRVLETESKALATLIGGGASLTLTDEQVRQMLGENIISVTVISGASESGSVIVSARVLEHARFDGSEVVLSSYSRLLATIAANNNRQTQSFPNYPLSTALGTNNRFLIITSAVPSHAILYPQLRVGQELRRGNTPNPITLDILENNRTTVSVLVPDNIVIIHPLGAGGNSDSASLGSLLELPSLPLELWQVSYTPLAKANPNLAAGRYGILRAISEDNGVRCGNDRQVRVIGITQFAVV